MRIALLHLTRAKEKSCGRELHGASETKPWMQRSAKVKFRFARDSSTMPANLRRCGIARLHGSWGRVIYEVEHKPLVSVMKIGAKVRTSLGRHSIIRTHEVYVARAVSRQVLCETRRWRAPERWLWRAESRRSTTMRGWWAAEKLPRYCRHRATLPC